MKFLTDIENIDIDVDVHDLTMDIDMIFHREITNRTGITISHRDTQNFIIDIINKNNKRQLEIRKRDKELRDSAKKFDKKYNNKIKQGKVVKDLNSIGNIIKYCIFGYIIVED